MQAVGEGDIDCIWGRVFEERGVVRVDGEDVVFRCVLPGGGFGAGGDGGDDDLGVGEGGIGDGHGARFEGRRIYVGNKILLE